MGGARVAVDPDLIRRHEYAQRGHPGRSRIAVAGRRIEGNLRQQLLDLVQDGEIHVFVTLRHGLDFASLRVRLDAHRWSLLRNAQTLGSSPK
jgi:hypothetical protein